MAAEQQRAQDEVRRRGQESAKAETAAAKRSKSSSLLSRLTPWRTPRKVDDKQTNTDLESMRASIKAHIDSTQDETRHLASNQSLPQDISKSTRTLVGAPAYDGNLRPPAAYLKAKEQPIPESPETGPVSSGTNVTEDPAWARLSSDTKRQLLQAPMNRSVIAGGNSFKSAAGA